MLNSGKLSSKSSSISKTCSGDEEIETKESDDNEWKSFLSDGLHLSSAGNKFLFEQLWNKHIEELTREDALFLPEWRDLG